MNQQTILQLNNLNKSFYQITAEDFDDSRQYYWDGWNKLLPIIRRGVLQYAPTRILDVGCGNARFAKFLSKNINQEFEYTGIDNSEELLAIAQNLPKLPATNYQLINLDIVEKLLNNKFTDELKESYDVIVLFGVMHHIPSFDLRKKLIEILADKLEPNGILVFTAWQFAKEERFKDRVVDPKQVGAQKLVVSLSNHIAPELESNDYILDWRRGEKAYRYCHFIDEEEIKKIINQIPQVKIVDQFYADGKSGKLNLYTILQSH